MWCPICKVDRGEGITVQRTFAHQCETCALRRGRAIDLVLSPSSGRVGSGEKSAPVVHNAIAAEDGDSPFRVLDEPVMFPVLK